MRGLFSVTIIYGIAAVLSLLLAAGSWRMIRKKEPWLLVITIAVFVVNTGYFMMSVSKSVEGALMANRISYFGSVFLPLGMLMAIIKLCRIQYNRVFVGVLVSISIAVFFLAASGGYLTVYYKSVSLEIVNGASRLVKEYGPLHCVYLFYLLGYFGMMVGIIVYSSEKKGIPHKITRFLAAVVLGNVCIWFVEQLIHVQFEFLSVSYVVTEYLMMLLYSMLYDGSFENGRSNPAEIPDLIENNVVETSIDEGLACSKVAELTAREQEVLQLILKNTKRKDIAEALGVSENTVKKHISHIFGKAEVSGRKELFERFGISEQEITDCETEEQEVSRKVVQDQIQKSSEKNAEHQLYMEEEKRRIFLEGIQGLTPTERRIYGYYLEGKQTKEILTLLNITENTLKYHNKNIYSKLGVRTRKELQNMAEELRKEQE